MRKVYDPVILLAFVLITTGTVAQTIKGVTSGLCPKGSGNIYNSDTGCGGADGSLWVVTGGNIASSGNTSSLGDYIVVVWDNVSKGTVANKCGSVNVTINSIAQPTISAGTLLLCGSGTTTIEAAVSSTANITDYKWSIVGTGVSPTGNVSTQTPKLTINYSNWAQGSASATIAVGTSNSGCNFSTPVSPLTDQNVGGGIIIHAIPRSAWVQLSPNPAGAGNPLSVLSNSTKYEMCPGESWTLTCTPPAGVSTNYGFDWYVNYFNGGSGVLINGAASSSTSLVHTSGNTVSLTAPSGYGSFTVAARLNGNGCISNQFVTLGTKRAGVYNSSEFSVVGPSSLCQNSTASYSPSLSGSDITSYKWNWSPSFKYQNGQGTPYLGVATINPFSGGSITLQLQNRCGYTSSPSVRAVGGRACAWVMVAASPNPASTTLQINISPLNGIANSSLATMNANSHYQSTVSGVLINESNVQLWSGVIDGDSHSIDISTFPNGIYYLKLNVDGEIVTQRVVIKH